MNRTPAIIGLAVSVLFATGSKTARAEARAEGSGLPAVVDEKDRDVYRRRLVDLTRFKSYFDLVATVMFGDGLRFNNPYRLPHDLGERGSSVSTTAPYVDLAVGVTTGNPNGFQHGGRLGWTLSLSGVPQQVFTPSYLAILRVAPQWMVYGWAGVPILAEPDVNLGAELAAGGAWFARAGFGATCAIVGDAFYGAGTSETRAAFYPVLSAQLGLFLNYEVLP